ncbi:MAG: gamma-glutamyltransferase [Candidatus Rokubacteria bacterium RBG_16_73_20]|nr:MAG: gamma-glutamyltransferase [Candidatus Rokubacteria bacterium RBG_16_73_20]
MLESRLVVTKETPLAARGLVAAEHPLGARVGAGVLAAGGNAVDAAVATAFAMTVVEPFMSTLAGSGTMLIHLAKRGETVALDFNGQAPARARDGMFRVIGGVSDGLFAWPRVEGAANEYGYLAVAVPGSVAGLALALERWGTLELSDALRPAIALAREGFVPDWYQALTTARYLEELTAFPETARTYLRGGRAIHRPPSLEPGERVTYPDLARSLELIARAGPDAFYRGELAQAIHEEMAAHGGLLTREDLAAYEVCAAPPLRGSYRGLELALAPGATGGITALEILNVLEQFPPTAVGWGTTRGLDVRARAVRRAFEDRFAQLGDARRIEAPWERLASKDYARAVAAELRRPARRRAGGRGAGSARARAAARSAGGGGDCTTHVSVVDRQRNMVALTHTAVSLFGARIVVPGTGILLNNGMIWFDPEPGKPNSVAPGKRALVNMVPVLAFRRGAPYLTLGAPGGRRIISAIPQVLATLADGGGSLQAAIEAPRLHDEGAELLVDERVGARALAGLARLGHHVVPREETYATLNFAKPVGIRVGRRGLEAGLDALRPAAAAGH